MRAVWQQNIVKSWQPLEFFSRCLTLSETSYSAFSGERLASYCAVKHFMPAVEGQNFILFTGNKPLTCALHTKSDGYSLWECRHFEHISQSTTNHRHLEGELTFADNTMPHNRSECSYFPGAWSSCRVCRPSTWSLLYRNTTFYITPTPRSTFIFHLRYYAVW